MYGTILIIGLILACAIGIYVFTTDFNNPNQNE